MKHFYLLSFILFSQFVSAAELVLLSPTQQKNLGVTVSPIKTATQLAHQIYPAEVVVPVNQIRVVSSAYAGLVDQLMVTNGQMVKQGQVLARITSPALVTMQREYLQSRAQRQLAKQSLDRDNSLFKEGVIAEKRLQVSQNLHTESAAQVSEQRQLLKLSGMADGAINQLENNNRYQSGLVLTAPITGVVLEQMVTQGQQIESTTPIFKLAQMRPLWVEVRVPLADVKKYHVQKGAAVSLKNVAASGEVIALMPSAQPQDQTAVVRVEIKQGAEYLFPSQMVDAMIYMAESNTGKTQFVVPTAAIVRHQARHFVFVKMAKGFEVKEVKVFNTQAAFSQVMGDFNGTEEVAVSGTATIKASWQGMGGAEE